MFCGGNDIVRPACSNGSYILASIFYLKVILIEKKEVDFVMRCQCLGKKMECKICGASVCNGHIGKLELPFPVLWLVGVDRWKVVRRWKKLHPECLKTEEELIRELREFEKPTEKRCEIEKIAAD